jgi:hypothetical protein
MQKTLEVLQQQKMEILKKLADIGNFRRGTISVNYRKCGKKNCVCAQQEHPGHGPQYLRKKSAASTSFSVFAKK